MTPRVVIVGAGGHGHVMLDVLRRQGGVEIVGFLDDRQELLNTETRDGLSVLGTTDWARLPPSIADAFVVAIGNNKIRRGKFEAARAAGLDPCSAVHPSAVIADTAELGDGVQVVGGVVVNPYAAVGCDAILNTACTVDHDCCIGDHAFLGPGVHLGGEVEVGEGAFLGIGSTVLPGDQDRAGGSGRSRCRGDQGCCSLDAGGGRARTGGAGDRAVGSSPQRRAVSPWRRSTLQVSSAVKA